MARFKAFLFCLTIALSGCEMGTDQTVTENKTDDSGAARTSVDPAKTETTVTQVAGDEKYTISSGEGAEMPKDFPADVFVYRPSKVISATDMPQGSVVGLTTPDDASKVAEAYKREMLARDWIEKTLVNHDGHFKLVYEKTARIANITIAPSEQTAQIGLMVTK